MTAHYFLTGGTGAVGSAFLQRMAVGDARITLLLRAATPSAAQARMVHLLAQYRINAAPDRIHAVAGDLQQPRLGLSAADHAHIVGHCTHLVHCAGNVRMNLPLAAARDETLGMTRRILSLRDAMGGRAPLAYVSTVGVAGHMTGEVPENWLTRPRVFRNTYEAAKAEAEQLVRAAGDARRPITVIRPSMVVGDSRSGHAGTFQVFYHLCEFLSGARTMGWIPKVGDMRLDIIPCDYVAAVLETALCTAPPTPPILHACAGPAGAVPLTHLIRRVRSRFAAHGRRLPPLRQVPLPLYQGLLRLARPMVTRRHRRRLDALPFFFAYLKERQWFANSRTLAHFASQSLAPPHADSYLDRVLDYYLGR
ncbi:SDR family oxidoreductase [Desulfatitalea alkaliphila]|uniref:SDR family oxidoreductase n=1 Tax=Desulfatitalea alkaliphila TaxID=2929485 RepID=A0AA41R1F5_9BACT|nr:SDR family oxidoreductase [Desulfatitalea alkaliphila]